MFWLTLGLLATSLGTLYPIPQVWRTIKTKKVVGISRYFLTLWILDKVLSLLYVIHLQDFPLTLKYGCGTILVMIIIWYRLFPKK